MPRLGSRSPQRRATPTDGHASSGISFIRRSIRIAHYHVHSLNRYVQFLSDDLRQCSTHTGSQFDLAAKGGDSPISFNLEPVIEPIRDFTPSRFAPTRPCSSRVLLWFRHQPSAGDNNTS